MGSLIENMQMSPGHALMLMTKLITERDTGATPQTYIRTPVSSCAAMDIMAMGEAKRQGPLALHDSGHETLLTKEERRGQESRGSM